VWWQLLLEVGTFLLLVVWVGVIVWAYLTFGDMIKEICNRHKGGY
jgi:hypothetical protein